MSLIRHTKPQPFLSEFQQDLSHFFLNSHTKESSTKMTPSADWIPTVDIIENAENYLIYADVPGIKPEDIEVSMDKNILSIKGSRSEDVREQGKIFKRVERARGNFLREFTIPDTADLKNIKAKTVDGVLTVTIPKGEDIKPRKIVVQ